MAKYPSNKVTLALKVRGMDNSHCVHIVGSALGRLEGIIDKKLSANEKAAITFNPKIVTAERIRQIINDAGYDTYEESTGIADREKGDMLGPYDTEVLVWR